jgi:hypothetical protein
MPSFSAATGQWSPPQAQTKIWASLVRMRRRTRWSSLAITLIIVGKLGALLVAGKWPLRRSPPGTMRGLDFYPWKDFLRAVIRGAYQFKAENGYLPRLVRPVNFNEHIFARKFFAPLPMPSLADKLAAKEYVKKWLGDGLVPEAVWVGDVDGLFAAKLPAGRYVLKANHGAGWNLVLNLPDDFSTRQAEIQQKATAWLSWRYGYNWGEWQYAVIKPKLFLERFIDFNGVQTPDDYKFFCFHGKVRLIEIDVDRSTELKSAFYTREWKYIPVTYGETPIQRPRPQTLEDMIRVAEAIADGMDFARVDLYTDGFSRVRFGEITFSPGGDGGLHFSDIRLDQWLGAQFANVSDDIFPWEG